jgi:chromosome partitioning protein
METISRSENQPWEEPMTSVKDVADYLGVTPVRVKQIIRDAGLEFVKETNGFVRVPGNTVRAIHALRNTRFRSTIATIGLQKGGVGKTTLSINTALAGAHKGARVLVLDLDPEACATQFLAKPGFDLTKAHTILEVIKDDEPIEDVIIPSRFEGIDFLPCRSRARRVDALVINENPATLLKEKVATIRERYDLILFDVPPSFNNLIAAAYLSSEVVICPVNSDVWSLESLELTKEDIEHAAKKWVCAAPEIRIVRNKVAPPQRRDTRETEVELAKDYAGFMLDISFKQTAALSNAVNDGSSIFESRAAVELRSSFLQLFDYLCPLEPLQALTKNKITLPEKHTSAGATSSASPPQNISPSKLFKTSHKGGQEASK